MNYILNDGIERNHLLPFTFTKPVADIRIGILTIKEKWDKHLKAECSFKTQNYLSEKFRTNIEDENIIINGNLLPDFELVNAIDCLKQNQKLVAGNIVLAVCVSRDELKNDEINYDAKSEVVFDLPYTQINHVWEIFSLNDKALRDDFELLTRGRTSKHIYAPNQLSHLENIFIEEGAKVSASILNGSTGPIYIGKDAEVMDGCMIRGPFALCDHATLKMGTKIYGATTIGPYCKVGGEVNNSVFFGYSNKAHDGFIGNSVIGEWCNLGADTNNSNLKNNYSNVKIWNYAVKQMVDTGLQFCGLFMGDHSKCSINTMFNTGTMVGVSANIFGSDFPPKYIPSFGWGGSKGFEKFMLQRAIELAEMVYDRRELVFDDVEKDIFKHLYEEVK